MCEQNNITLTKQGEILSTRSVKIKNLLIV